MLNEEILPEDTPHSPPPEMYDPLENLQHQTNEISLGIPQKRFFMVLRGNQENTAFQKFFTQYFDAPYPQVLETLRLKGLIVYWQSPDQLLLSFETHTLLCAWYEKLLSQKPEELHLSLVDVSDYYCCIRLRGTRAFDVIRQGCPFDFRVFAKYQAVQSHFDKANILLDYADDDTLDVIVRTSFAAYLWKYLVYCSNQLHGFS